MFEVNAPATVRFDATFIVTIFALVANMLVVVTLFETAKFANGCVIFEL